MGPDGELAGERSEPIAADVRPGKDGRNDAKLKLVAGMLGVSLDELKQREAQRRHRRAMLLAAASVAGMAITSTLATAAWFARNDAERQRARAEAEAETARQTTRFMVDLFKVSDPSEALGNTITAREILDRGAGRIERELGDQPAIQATLMDTMGTVYTSLGLYDPAARLVREAHAKRSPEVAQTLMLLADVLPRQGRFEDAEPAIREALTIRRALHGPKHADVAASIEALGLSHYDRGEYDEAVPSLRLALAMRREMHPQGHPLLAQAMGNLAWALMDLGQLEEAERLHREARRILKLSLPDDHWQVAAALSTEGTAIAKLGDFAVAEPMLIASLPGLEHSPIPGLPAVGRQRLRELYVAWGRPADAARYR